MFKSLLTIYFLTLSLSTNALTVLWNCNAIVEGETINNVLIGLGRPSGIIQVEEYKMAINMSILEERQELAVYLSLFETDNNSSENIVIGGSSFSVESINKIPKSFQLMSTIDAKNVGIDCKLDIEATNNTNEQ